MKRKAARSKYPVAKKTASSKLSRMRVAKARYAAVTHKKLIALLQVDGTPSTTTNEMWIYAFRRPGRYPRDTSRSGKWLVYVARVEVDDLWATINSATLDGRLGPCAKVATARPNQFNADRSHVICVYTYDSDDTSDVSRVRDELRRLGVVEPISYKTDVATNEGLYANGGQRRVSKYRE